jgi:hypothetical protein
MRYVIIIIIIIIIIELNCKWIFTRWQWYYNKTQNTAHKDTQTIKDTLHTMNTTQKSKVIPATGRGGLQSCGMLRIPHCIGNRFMSGGFMTCTVAECYQRLGRTCLHAL